jgi:hypothetical protein
MESNNNCSLDLLRALRTRLDRGDRRILIDYPLQFTKGETYPTYCELFVDHRLKIRVSSWIEQRGSFTDFMFRYHDFDTRLIDKSWPAHFPVHILNATGQITEGRNIFMFFPEVLGLSTGLHEDYFGLELIDVWEAVFDQVVTPCVQCLFDVTTQFDYFEVFYTYRRELIYLASVFHEIGHRVGYWKVSPFKDEQIHLSTMQGSIMGELSTDTYLVKFIPEFSELGSFVLYQRLFWFGRMHYEIDKIHGALNTDCDAWIGAYLWQVAERVGCLRSNADNGLWHIDQKLITTVFDTVFDDLQALGSLLIRSINQIDTLQQWMEKQVPRDEDGRFIYPDTMDRALSHCNNIPTRVRIQQHLKEQTCLTSLIA